MSATPAFHILGHAVKRGLLRGFTTDQMIETCEKPEESKATYPNATTGATRRRHFKRFGGKKLCVVLESACPPLIVTAYWMNS